MSTSELRRGPDELAGTNEQWHIEEKGEEADRTRPESHSAIPELRSIGAAETRTTARQPDTSLGFADVYADPPELKVDGDVMREHAASVAVKAGATAVALAALILVVLAFL